ncbi:glycosyltransferase [Arenibacter sp. GZD96]|uniref:glycosyltransferase n=1 Tax=Aurantibrevibacter litoralis TaxID=3106030 RepID=UPI002AFFF5BE|nr:glycosyltransferase [Arenibacter sp. GZD-96]MEA1787680.1 glycosyltransferase [Arenibacter sp. GZD-96]
MKLSIVIPCYNMEKYLPACLDSLFRQDLPIEAYEIIVVNDESKDNTLGIALDYQRKYPNIQIIDKKNAGVGAARNSGLDKAIGTYIYFLDPDDFIADNVLGLLLQVLEENSLDILTFKSKSFKSLTFQQSVNLQDINASVSIMDGISYIAQHKYKNEIWWFISNRQFLVASGIRFIEGKWMEDAILAAQLFCAAGSMAHIGLDVHRYRILPTSAMRNKSPEHYNKVIFDNANAAHAFRDLIESVPKDHENYIGAVTRLKTRQQSFVFFLLVRLMKSDLPVGKIPEMLHGFEQIDAYPLHKFLGPDYHGMGYSFLTFVFNNKPLIHPFIKVFRTFYTFVK